jgi:hypothetical protein
MTEKNNMSGNQRIENFLTWNFNIRTKQSPIQTDQALFCSNLFQCKYLQMNNFIVCGRRCFHNGFRHGWMWMD